MTVNSINNTMIIYECFYINQSMEKNAQRLLHGPERPRLTIKNTRPKQLSKLTTKPTKLYDKI